MDNKYGRLTIISAPFVENGHSRVFVKCDCGNEKIVRLSHLKSGFTTSCGCYSSECKKKRSTTHGLSHTHPLYSVWQNMKNRCYNKNIDAYKDYGQRGISICDEWRYDFKKFYDWCISNGWSKELCLDRINNDGNYEPNNCRYVTQKVNCRNKRRTLTESQVIEIRELLKYKKMKGVDIAKFYDKCPSTISAIATGKNWSND